MKDVLIYPCNLSSEGFPFEVVGVWGEEEAVYQEWPYLVEEGKEEPVEDVLIYPGNFVVKGFPFGGLRG